VRCEDAGGIPAHLTKDRWPGPRTDRRGLHVIDVVEPEWPESNTETWEGGHHLAPSSSWGPRSSSSRSR